jgi:hypothetical protein
MAPQRVRSRGIVNQKLPPHHSSAFAPNLGENLHLSWAKVRRFGGETPGTSTATWVEKVKGKVVLSSSDDDESKGQLTWVEVE